MSIDLRNSTSPADLKKVKLPKATKSYKPVPHIEVINMTLEELEKAGLKVLDASYSSARDGRQARGDYSIGGENDKEMTIKLSWINSYDKSIPLGWAVGANIIVCSNGMVRGDDGAFRRKHTGTILSEYKENIHLYVNKVGDTFKKLVKDREALKRIDLDKRTISELIGRMFIEEEIVTATQMGIIKREIENPSFNYNADGSAWQLYNHVTVAMKEDHPQHYINRHVKHHDFFMREFDLA